MIFAYVTVIFFLTIYSYALIDPNLTFFQTWWWVLFRDKMVYLGYYRRDLSWVIYLTIITLLFIFHYFFIKKYKKINILRLSLIIALILVFSYPFLSHDFFNYMFDAKIVTVYHKSPYLFKALDFPKDQWLRFMQWTHRTYPYGPTFLLITFLPSFLSFGKFFLDFFLFKIMFVLFYLIAVYFLQKLNKKWAIFFATNPLVIIEGLVSSHNDLIVVSLAIVGIYYLFNKKNLLSRIFLVLSAGIKYITLPLIFITKDKKIVNSLAVGCLIIILLYLSLKSEIQPWYFLSLFSLIPFYQEFIGKFNLFFIGLLLSYYPYIRLVGEWGNKSNIDLKHWIIGFFLMMNIFYIVLKQVINLKSVTISNKR